MMTKKFLSMFLALVMCLSLTAPAGAAENDSDDGWVCSETAVSSTTEENEVAPHSTDLIPQLTVLESCMDTVVTEPSGQYPGGYNFPTGGSVYVNTSGGTKISVELTAAWAIKGKLSVSVSIGAVSNSNVGGYFVDIPADNNYYRIKVKHTYLIEHIRVDLYSTTGILIDTYETNRVTPYGVSAYPVKV